MLLCCMLLCWRMGEARRERSIAACALVPAMGISCGRARAGMRPMGGDVDGGMAAEGVRRQGSSAPDDSEGDRQVQGAHRRKLPRRRQRPPTTVRSSRGGVVGGEDEKLESGGEGGREERRCERRRGAWVTSRALLPTLRYSYCYHMRQRCPGGARTGGG